MSPIFTLTDKYIRFSFKKGQVGKNSNKLTVHELNQISYLRLNLELEKEILKMLSSRRPEFVKLNWSQGLKDLSQNPEEASLMI